MAHSKFLTALLAGLSLMVIGMVAKAEDIPYWPSERDARFAETEGRFMQVQQQLFDARMQGRATEAQRLQKTFRELTAERGALLRALQFEN